MPIIKPRKIIFKKQKQQSQEKIEKKQDEIFDLKNMNIQVKNPLIIETNKNQQKDNFKAYQKQNSSDIESDDKFEFRLDQILDYLQRNGSNQIDQQFLKQKTKKLQKEIASSNEEFKSEIEDFSENQIEDLKQTLQTYKNQLYQIKTNQKSSTQRNQKCKSMQKTENSVIQYQIDPEKIELFQQDDEIEPKMKLPIQKLYQLEGNRSLSPVIQKEKLSINNRIDKFRPSKLEINRGSESDRLPLISRKNNYVDGLISPNIVQKIKKSNWKKISQMINKYRNERDLDNFESEMLNSPIETKRFIQKIEDDIGLKKALYSKPHYLKYSFKPNTMKKYRESGGVPPSNQQVHIDGELNQFNIDLTINLQRSQ